MPRMNGNFKLFCIYNRSFILGKLEFIFFEINFILDLNNHLAIFSRMTVLCVVL